ncbi:MAG: ABC transporter substrate-binding protein [Acidobacteriota bacterium]
MSPASAGTWTATAVFGDLRVRKAMTAACNTPRMIRELAYNLYTRAYGVFHPDSWMFNPEIKLIPFDLLTRRLALLDEAGWKVDESQGGLALQGRRRQAREVRVHDAPAAGDRDLPRPVRDLQEDLQSIGVKMNTPDLEWAALSGGCASTSSSHRWRPGERAPIPTRARHLALHR